MRFLEQDKNGFLLNAGGKELIQTEYIGVLRDVVVEMRKSIDPNNLISIYVVGSVARGEAVLNKSDIDLVIVTSNNRLVPPHICDGGSMKQLMANYPFVTNIQCDLLDKKTAIGKYFDLTSFVLKTQSVLLHGKDIRESISGFKPDIYLANSEIIQLKSDIAEAKEEIESAKPSEAIVYWCRRIMKNILRDAYFIVMYEEGKYSVDNETLRDVFIKYHPDLDKDISRVADLIGNPIDSKDELLGFLNSFGVEMEALAEDWLKVNNPNLVTPMTIKHTF